MPKAKVYRAENEVYILKAQAVALPDKRAMLVLYMTKPRINKTGEGFKKTVVKVGPMSFWKNLLEDLGNNNPGELVRTSMLGYQEDYLIYISKTHATRTYLKNILTKKFENAMFLKDFLDKQIYEEKLGYRDRFAQEFNNGEIKISEYEKMKDDIWYDSTHITFKYGRPRKKPKVVM